MGDETLVLGVLLTVADCEEIGSLVFESTIEVLGLCEFGCSSVNNARGFRVIY